MREARRDAKRPRSRTGTLTSLQHLLRLTAADLNASCSVLVQLVALLAIRMTLCKISSSPAGRACASSSSFGSSFISRIGNLAA